MRLADARRLDRRGEVRRHRACRRRPRPRASTAASSADQVGRRRDEIACDREQVRRSGADSGTPPARRASAALRTRCASIGTSWRRFEPTMSSALERVDLGDPQPELGKGRLGLLVAEIALPQAMIDVVAAEAARDPREQIQLLDAWRERLASTPQRRGARLAGPPPPRSSATSQSLTTQRAAVAQHRPLQRDRRCTRPRSRSGRDRRSRSR